LVKVLKKQMAKQLKKIFGTWWVAMSDPHQPARQNATEAYSAAFPPEKRVEVILYCKAELMAHLSTNLNSTPQTLTSTLSIKLDSLEEKEMHDRVVTSTLSSIARLLNVLGDNEHQQLMDFENGYKQLFSAGFWRVVVSKVSSVRCAAYGVLVAIIDKCPHIIDTQLPKATQCVLGALGEKEANLHSQMWPALLSFLRQYPHAWSEIQNPGKQVFGKLWSMLRNGCYGSAACSYPSLLPLLASLPSELLDRMDGALVFVDKFLTELWGGINCSVHHAEVIEVRLRDTLPH
jgi:hypothetical protein